MSDSAPVYWRGALHFHYQAFLSKDNKLHSCVLNYGQAQRNSTGSEQRHLAMIGGVNMGMGSRWTPLVAIPLGKGHCMLRTQISYYKLCLYDSTGRKLSTSGRRTQREVYVGCLPAS